MSASVDANMITKQMSDPDPDPPLFRLSGLAAPLSPAPEALSSAHITATCVDTKIKAKEMAVANSPLFRLPGELRNEIYRHYFGNEEDLVITPSGVTEPALLSTCHIIRDESTSLFYHGKLLNLKMEKYDSSIFMKWNLKERSLRHAYAIRFSLCAIPDRMEPNRRNLGLWLYRYYAGIVTCTPNYVEFDHLSCTQTNRMVRAIFDTMASLKAARVPWPIIWQALQPGITLLARCLHEAWE